jgi:hypothetical protein
MSVKVAVRVRPFNQREEDGGSKCCIEMVSKTFAHYIYSLVPQLSFMITLTMARTLLLITVFGLTMVSKLQLMEETFLLEINMLIRSLFTMLLESRSLIMPGKGTIAACSLMDRLDQANRILW